MLGKGLVGRRPRRRSERFVFLPQPLTFAPRRRRCPLLPPPPKGRKGRFSRPERELENGSSRVDVAGGPARGTSA